MFFKVLLHLDKKMENMTSNGKHCAFFPTFYDEHFDTTQSMAISRSNYTLCTFENGNETKILKKSKH